MLILQESPVQVEANSKFLRWQNQLARIITARGRPLGI